MNKVTQQDPYLAEFIYDTLHGLTEEQRRKLSIHFLKIAATERRSQIFSLRSSTDEKMRFWTELGFSCGLFFIQDDVKSASGLKEALKKLEEGKQVAASKEMAKAKIFVTSDKWVRHQLGLMADTIHHKSYFINQELLKVGYSVKKWKRKNLTGLEVDDVKTSIEDMDLITTVMLNTFNIFSYLTTFGGLEADDGKIILYLFKYKHTYISKERLRDYFFGHMRPQKLTSRIKRLLLNGIIQKHHNIKVLQYTITSLGIKVVNEMVDKAVEVKQFSTI